MLTSDFAKPEHPVLSPSGKYLLQIDEEIQDGIPWSYFEILTSDRQNLYRSNDRFDMRHATLFLWDSEDRIWVYSGDLGVFIWQRDSQQSNWIKTEYSVSKLTPPDALKKAKPFIFK